MDKGYIYGRVTHDKKSTHCPEIEILIHDTKNYPSLFRMDDFVIVQPEAVRGIIQVKRTFRTVAKENHLERGLQQAVAAKQHISLIVLWTVSHTMWLIGFRWTT